MNEMEKVLGTWQVDMRAVRERMYGAPTAQERERWHAIWLMSRGMTAAQVGEALEWDAHTIARVRAKVDMNKMERFLRPSRLRRPGPWQGGSISSR